MTESKAFYTSVTLFCSTTVMNTNNGTYNLASEDGTIDREYYAGSKVARAKYSISFNFVNLACVRNYFNPEILIHGVFPLRTHGKQQSMGVYEMESRVQGYHVYKDIAMGCHDWRRSFM